MFGFITASLSREKKLYKSVKNILGFYPGNIFLYRLAFRHKSASRVVGNVKSNNERLEYLGDSVISTAVAHYLFKRYPNKDEGFLTEMRSKMVSRATLNKVALKMGLHELLNIDSKSGGFKSVDGNALEALMGAVFLDKGYKFTEKIILRRIVAVHIDMDEMESRDWNYKSKLIDWGQKERYKVTFQVLSTVQQKGKKLYKVAALVNSEIWGEGMDQSIKAAEQISAENAYKNKVIPFIEKQSKKGYREPLGDENVKGSARIQEVGEERLSGDGSDFRIEEHDVDLQGNSIPDSACGEGNRQHPTLSSRIMEMISSDDKKAEMETDAPVSSSSSDSRKDESTLRLASAKPRLSITESSSAQVGITEALVSVSQTDSAVEYQSVSDTKSVSDTQKEGLSDVSYVSDKEQSPDSPGSEASSEGRSNVKKQNSSRSRRKAYAESLSASTEVKKNIENVKSSETVVPSDESPVVGGLDEIKKELE